MPEQFDAVRDGRHLMNDDVLRAPDESMLFDVGPTVRVRLKSLQSIEPRATLKAGPFPFPPLGVRIEHP